MRASEGRRKREEGKPTERQRTRKVEMKKEPRHAGEGEVPSLTVEEENRRRRNVLSVRVTFRML